MNAEIRILCLLLSVSLIWGSPVAGAEKGKAASLTTFGEVVDVNVVNVDVYATDKSGRRVSDLRRGDFERWEAGKRGAITNFVPPRLPPPGSPQAPSLP